MTEPSQGSGPHPDEQPSETGGRAGRQAGRHAEIRAGTQRPTGPGGRLRGMLDSTAPRVFFPAAVIILAFVIGVFVAPHTIRDGERVTVAQVWIEAVQGWVVNGFGWYYVLIIAGFIVFSLWMAFGHFGDIKLGADDDEPEFGLLPWLAMLFAAGMGIGLMFYGAYEPLAHLYEPKPGTPENNPALVPGQPGFAEMQQSLGQQALVLTYLHWGLHPWAIYVVVGLAIAYAVHRKGRPVSIRWALEPVLGDRVKGWLGDIIDIAAVVGTLFGVATSLGLGALQVAEGMSQNGVDIPTDEPGGAHIVIITVITLIATASVVSGVDRGIKWLSNINMGLAGLLLLFVALAGPVLFLFRTWIESIGTYLQNLIALSLDVNAWQVGNDAGLAWQGSWTLFYWGWWISWAPFVGVFIARISRGRTVREFVLGVLVVPSLVGFLWFAVFGGSGLYRQIFGAGDLFGPDGPSETGALFQVLDGLPLAAVTGWLAVILVVVFFVTSSDSGSFVVDMLASGGDPQPPVWSRVFWALLEGAVAIALLLAGGLGALQGMAILIAFPFSIVMLFMCAATLKQFRAERRHWLRLQRRQQREEMAGYLVDHGYIER